jgi:hypothetical protein
MPDPPQGSTDVMAQLLAEGVAVDALTEDGQTALIIAVMNADSVAAELLMQHQANPLLQDPSGRSAIDLVDGIEEALLDMCANPKGGEASAVAAKSQVWAAIAEQMVRSMEAQCAALPSSETPARKSKKKGKGK